LLDFNATILSKKPKERRINGILISWDK